MKTFSNLIIGAGLLAAASPVVAGEKKEAAAGRPNILFILSDDHTSQAWGIYGGILGEYVKNENIRRLAAEGCVLDNCFCTNSIAVPLFAPGGLQSIHSLPAAASCALSFHAGVKSGAHISSQADLW